MKVQPFPNPMLYRFLRRVADEQKMYVEMDHMQLANST